MVLLTVEQQFDNTYQNLFKIKKRTFEAANPFLITHSQEKNKAQSWVWGTQL